MIRIEYYLSLLSPFCYLAGLRLEEIAARHGATVVHRPVDVLRLFSLTGGTPPAQRPESRKAYRLQELTRQSARTGLALNLKPAHWPTDAAPASAAVIAVAEAGGEVGPLVHAFLRSVWAGERDIADPGVVAEVLAAHGHDAGALASAMDFAASTYHANTDAAAAAGAFGVPFYIVDGEMFWGQDRLDDLDWHLGGRQPG